MSIGESRPCHDEGKYYQQPLDHHTPAQEKEPVTDSPLCLIHLSVNWPPRIGSHSISRIEEFLPWNCAPQKRLPL
jgi:hypothetical protein